MLEGVLLGLPEHVIWDDVSGRDLAARFRRLGFRLSRAGLFLCLVRLASCRLAVWVLSLAICGLSFDLSLCGCRRLFHPDEPTYDLGTNVALGRVSVAARGLSVRLGTRGPSPAAADRSGQALGSAQVRPRRCRPRGGRLQPAFAPA